MTMTPSKTTLACGPGGCSCGGSCGGSCGNQPLEADPLDEFSLADRVAAKYKRKKTIKTQQGKEMTVYEYSDRQIANRNKAKAKKIEGLKKHIGDLRAKVKSDLKSDDPDKMLTALAVALMDETFERVGNDESAKDGHFGVTGWQRKHISFGKKTTITYVGKSGVKHKKEITDAGLKKALRDAYEAVEGDDTEILSWEGGRVTAEKVNAYLKDFGVTAKDIRGFHANDTMQAALKAVRKGGGKLPEDKKKREKQLKEEFKKALEETAEAVGHEAATLRSQYLVPGLEEDFVDNGEVDGSFVKTASERVLARYLGELLGRPEGYGHAAADDDQLGDRPSLGPVGVDASTHGHRVHLPAPEHGPDLRGVRVREDDGDPSFGEFLKEGEDPVEVVGGEAVLCVPREVRGL